MFHYILVSGCCLEISPQGGYTGLVVTIKDDVPEDKCKVLIQNLKVSKAQVRQFDRTGVLLY